MEEVIKIIEHLIETYIKAVSAGQTRRLADTQTRAPQTHAG